MGEARERARGQAEQNGHALVRGQGVPSIAQPPAGPAVEPDPEPGVRYTHTIEWAHETEQVFRAILNFDNAQRHANGKPPVDKAFVMGAILHRGMQGILAQQAAFVKAQQRVIDPSERPDAPPSGPRVVLG